MKALLIFSLLLSVSTADELYMSEQGNAQLNENRYIRDVNEFQGKDNHERVKRQGQHNAEFFVTQCSSDNTVEPDGPSINVLGRDIDYAESTYHAAVLVHRMVRFMPRPLFVKLANNSAVGLFTYRDLPSSKFPEFADMPSGCSSSCRTIFTATGTYDCSRFCTSSVYPGNKDYPISFLWAYGNYSRTFVVESNVMCQGFNPSQGLENYLIREFGITVITRGLDESTVQQVVEAFNMAVQNFTWSGITNEYDYFMKGTQAWFNGVSGASPNSPNLGGMSCINKQDGFGQVLCTSTFTQRMFIKERDLALYNILNYVYNNNREYAESFSSVCHW